MPEPIEISLERAVRRLTPNGAVGNVSEQAAPVPVTRRPAVQFRTLEEVGFSYVGYDPGEPFSWTPKRALAGGWVYAVTVDIDGSAINVDLEVSTGSTIAGAISATPFLSINQTDAAVEYNEGDFEERTLVPAEDYLYVAWESIVPVDYPFMLNVRVLLRS